MKRKNKLKYFYKYFTNLSSINNTFNYEVPAKNYNDHPNEHYTRSCTRIDK